MSYCIFLKTMSWSLYVITLKYFFMPSTLITFDFLSCVKRNRFVFKYMLYLFKIYILLQIIDVLVFWPSTIIRSGSCCVDRQKLISSLKKYLYYYYNQKYILRTSNTLMLFYLYVTIRDECIIFPLVPFSRKNSIGVVISHFQTTKLKINFKTFLYPQFRNIWGYFFRSCVHFKN